MIEPVSEEDGGGFPGNRAGAGGLHVRRRTRAEAVANVEDAIATWIYARARLASRSRSLGSTGPRESVKPQDYEISIRPLTEAEGGGFGAKVR